MSGGEDENVVPPLQPVDDLCAVEFITSEVRRGIEVADNKDSHRCSLGFRVMEHQARPAREPSPSSGSGMDHVSVLPARRPTSFRVELETAVLVGGLFLAGVIGALVAQPGPFGVALGSLVVLVLLGIRYPALPFLIVLAIFAGVSSIPGENPVIPRLASVYDIVTSGLTPADAVLGAAAVCAFIAFASMPLARRANVRTRLGAPILAFVAAALFSSQLVQGEGLAGLIALGPTLRFAFTFFIASVLFASGLLSGRLVLRLTVAAAQVIGVVGIYNVVAGLPSTPSALQPEGGFEAQAAFYDSASVFVLVIALLLLVVRVLWTNPARRLGYLALMPLPLTALMLSGRRSMYIALALGIIIVIAPSVRARASLLLPSIGLVAALVTALFVFAQSSPVYAQRVKELDFLFSSGTPDAAISDRQIETGVVFDNILRHPLLGIGADEPYTSSVPFRSQAPRYVHNTLLAVWLKFGLLGLAAFTWLVVRIARLGPRMVGGLTVSVRLTEAQAALAAFAAVVGFLSALLTASFLTASQRFPIFAGVLLALIATAAKVGASQPSGVASEMSHRN
jgi:hypothetical protein